MTRRFPRTETLIPDDLRAALIANGRASEELEHFDPRPVVKLFTPEGSATRLITEAYEEPDGDLRLFGLCDLGQGSPELGYVMLSEIEEVRGGLGLPVEHDLYFRPEYRLSRYAEIASHAGRLVT
ncbi:transposase [Agrobacterium tumefaciens]|nr:transposase [Agrobacterium tumefaciens]KAJ32807.1 transposase [Agrobacterium tumefaciens]